MLIQKSIKHQIELNAIDEDGRTGFHTACTDANLKLVEMFLDKSLEFNIDLNSKDDEGRTPFHWACIGFSKDRLRMIELMMERSDKLNIEFDIKDNNGMTPIDFARSFGNFELVNVLMQKLPNKRKMYR